MASDNQANELPVLVIGAGSCGLAIAHGLQRANIPVIVFEQQIDIQSRAAVRDWAVGLQWAGPILAKLVGESRWSRIWETGVDPNMTIEDIKSLPPVKLLHGVTGEPLAEIGTDGEPFFRLLRSRLIAFLSDGIDVQYGKTLDRFSCEPADGSHEGIVTAYFTDGTQVKGRLLIGADGVKSRVRSQLFERDPKQAALNRLPYATSFVNASFTADQARYLRAAQLHPLGCVMPHPKRLSSLLCILDAAQAGHPETWKFTFYVSGQCSIAEQDKEATPRERLQEAKQMVKDHGFGDPLKSVYEWVPDDTESVYYSKVANWDPSLPEHKWENHDGLVTLAGDACHPMTYHRGQGLNHAIADAGRIVELLSSADKRSLKERIDDYEAEMRERGGQEVRLSELNTRMVHDWEKLMNSPIVTRGLRKGTE